MTESTNHNNISGASDQSQVRRMKRGNWYWIEKVVIQEYARKVGPLAITVYCYLASFTNAEQSCYPSQRLIGEVLGYSRTSINRAIKKLERHGLIRIDKIDRTEGYQQTYTLLEVGCNTEESRV
jgi:biotin operon repressor